MYAVVKIRDVQFRVEPSQRLEVPLLEAEPGAQVTFEEVLLLADGDTVTVGRPLVAGCRVAAEVVRHGRDPKILVFKKKRRKNYRRTRGHRQHFTEIRVTDIVAG
jgi:large subunit ribosomal protein L21